MGKPIKAYRTGNLHAACLAFGAAATCTESVWSVAVVEQLTLHDSGSMSAASTYCMTIYLAEGGEGLGTVGLPEPALRDLAAKAGYAHLRRVQMDNCSTASTNWPARRVMWSGDDLDLAAQLTAFCLWPCCRPYVDAHLGVVH